MEKFGIVLAKLEIYSDKINNFTIKTREKLKDFEQKDVGPRKRQTLVFHVPPKNELR